MNALNHAHLAIPSAVYDAAGPRSCVREQKELVAEKLELSEERVADYVGETGNTSAASIPLTLSLLREDGRLRPGQRLLLSAVGAGFTWGAGVVDWGVR